MSTATHAIYAYRRPVAIAWVYACEAAIAWIVAAPWVETIASFVGAHPEGDRVLFWQPGLVLLVELIVRYSALVRALGVASLLPLVAYGLVSPLLLGALLGALTSRGHFGMREAGAWSGRLFGRLEALQITFLLFAAVLFVVFGVFPSVFISTLVNNLRSPWLTVAFISAPIFVIAIAIGWFFSLCDLARAFVARHDQHFTVAIGLSLRSPRAVSRLFWLSIPRWVASLGMLGFTSMFASNVASVIAIGLAHQVAAIARVSLRASVLATALRITDDILGKPSDAQEQEPEDISA